MKNSRLTLWKSPANTEIHTSSPLVEDKLVIPRSDILLVLEEFQAVGKSKKSYKLSVKDEETIIQKFNEWLLKNL